jgi:ubiquinone/menaquinone biosynthesis C-methylase UbiE
MATVCEVGVGGGYYARALAPVVWRYLGIDLQLAMLRRLRAMEAQVCLVQADGSALPLPAESVDVVVVVTVLGEIPQPEAAVAEIARILRPGGTLSVSEHVPDPDYVPFAQLRSLCTSAGLELVSRHGPVWYTANFRKPTRLN